MWLTYLRKQEAQRKRHGVVLNKVQYRAWLRDQSQTFELSSDDGRKRLLGESRSLFDGKQATRELAETDDTGPRELSRITAQQRVLQTVVSMVGDKR